MKLFSLYNLYILALPATTTSALSLSQKPLPPSPKTSPSFPSVLEIPLLGFGTWNLSPTDHNASHAVTHALKSGYRHIDCATAYKNQPDVGHGIKHGLKAAGLVREQIWVTSKLWNDHHEPDKVEDALNATLAVLGVGYLDLWLMHWPVGSDGGKKEIKFLETWKAMEKLVSTNRVRNIGISNFSPSQLRALLGAASIKPYAHQMELHPYLPQSAWLQYHREQGIRVTAYSPLGNSNPTYHKDTLHAEKQGSPPPPPLLQHPTLKRIAKDRGCTPATVALTWGITRGVSVIPKSQHKERIEENLRVCELEYEDVHALQRLGMRNLTRFNNPGNEWGVRLFEGLEDA